MLLFNLVQALDNSELTRLKQARFTAPENALLLYCVRVKEKKIFPSNTAIKQLGFSKSYLHKLSSLLLNKVLQFLYTADFTKQVSALSTKVKLVGVVRHLMKVHEKQLLAQKNKDALRTFYLKCFDIESGQYASDYNPKLMKYYNSRFLLYQAPAKRAHTMLDHDMKMHDTASNHFGSLGRLENPKLFKQYDEKFIEQYNKAVRLKYYDLQVKCLMYRCNLHFMIQGNSAAALPFLDTALKTTQAHSAGMPPGTELMIRARQAKANYFLSNFETAYYIYEQMDTDGAFAVKGITGADVSKYVQVALVTGHYNKAGELIQRVFSKFFGANNSADVMAQLQQIKHKVYVAAYADAVVQCERVIKMAKSMKLLQYVVEGSILLSMALFFTGNRHRAYLVAENSMKQLYAKNKTGGVNDFIEAFRLLKALSKGNALTAQQQKILDKFQTDSYSQYGILFKRMQVK